jgi:membrane protein implicated in regulation of membrane protease activity
MAESTIWWLLAGAAVAVELVTGTFYLLMLAIGLAAGALAAHAGAGTSVQLLVTAIVGSSTVAGWHLLRSRRPADLPAQANRDVNLDIGETVHVDAWDAEGLASIKYRGANWTAQAAAGTLPATGAHRVREIVGNRLIVEKI